MGCSAAAKIGKISSVNCAIFFCMHAFLAQYIWVEKLTREKVQKLRKERKRKEKSVQWTVRKKKWLWSYHQKNLKSGRPKLSTHWHTMVHPKGKIDLGGLSWSSVSLTVWPEPILKKVSGRWQIPPQHHSTYLGGPESPLIEIPPFRPHSIKFQKSFFLD